MPLESILLIGLIFCFGYGIESIFGVGGTIISLTILSFFFDIKDMAILTAFASLVAALFILQSDYKNFKGKILLKVLLILLPSIILGALFLKDISSEMVLKVFGGFLIFYAIWTLLLGAKKFFIPKILKPFVLFIGGLFGGVYGTPGPFVIISMREVVAHKSEMRILIASILGIMSVFRIGTYSFTGQAHFSEIIPFLWIIFPLFFTVWLGHKIHVKISERTFQLGLSLLLGLSGISFLI